VSESPEIADPTSGQRWVFKPTGGDALEADLYISAGGYVREHMHPSQEETFVGVSGSFVVDVDGARKTVGPGDTLVVPARTPHGFRDAAEDAHVVVQVRPALRLESYFRTFLGLSRDGRIRMPAKGRPYPLLQIAIVLDAYAAEVAMPGVPLGMQRPLLRLLAELGRLSGLPTSFPEYV
jgi:quercetin dioxygenase-like cupin family protein